MSLANTAQSYGSVARGLHWLTALLILALIPLGFVANALPWDTPEALAAKAQVFSVHKTLGVALFFTALVRILWAMTQPKPGPIHPERRVETLATGAVHWALYGAMVIVPLSGWVEHAATEGFAPILWPFGQGLPLVPKSEAVAGAAAGVHWLGGRVLMAALALHVAGAVKHHFVDRDATLRRMWFGTTEGGSASRENWAPVVTALALWAAVLVAGVGLAPAPQGAVGTTLAPVASGWAVEDGTLSLSVTQFGQTITGRFGTWTAAIEFDRESGTGHVEVTVAIPSLTIGSVSKEAAAPLYFDAEGHPEAQFVAEIAPEGERYAANGTLTLKGKEVPVALPFTLTFDGEVAAMTGQVTLDRRDFGIGDPADNTLGTVVAVEVNLTARRKP
jgi:cytochrome b561/polyisoprenoid-binding protein YceI